MIHEVVPVIGDELNSYLKRKFAITEDKVILSNITDQSGNMAVKSENKIIVSIVNITKDGTKGGTGGATNFSNMPMNMSVYILFAAYFNSENYVEALKFLSGVVGFFQKKRTFSKRNSAVPASAGTVYVELMKLSFDELSNMWSSIGAKYMPSTVFRIRSLSITDSRVHNTAPRVRASAKS